MDRLSTWYREGLLFIGDAAHAMSPVGGVGINLAVQDAIAAANVLVPTFRHGEPTAADLARIQERRLRPTRWMQGVQVAIQNRVLGPVLENDGAVNAPWALRLFNTIPALRRIPGRVIGMGFRPERPAYLS